MGKRWANRGKRWANDGQTGANGEVTGATDDCDMRAWQPVTLANASFDHFGGWTTKPLAHLPALTSSAMPGKSVLFPIIMV